MLVCITLCCDFSIDREAFECLKFVENYSEYSLRSRYEILKRQDSFYATTVASYGRHLYTTERLSGGVDTQRESVMTKSGFGSTMKGRKSAGGVL